MIAERCCEKPQKKTRETKLLGKIRKKENTFGGTTDCNRKAILNQNINTHNLEISDYSGA